MDNFSITKNGKPLDESLYSIDFKKKVFISKEIHLVLDFTELEKWSFITNNICTFITGRFCTFTTGNECTFTTGHDCIFDTGNECTFSTRGGCTFSTGWDCMFKTWNNCTFKTSEHCIFKTCWQCTFDVGDLCTFSVYNINGCKFKIGSGYEVYEHGIIVDRKDNKHYVLTKELIKMLKVKNG